MALSLALYAAAAVLSWGIFLSADKYDKMPIANVVGALLWPISWLAIVGFAIGSGLRR